MTRRLHAHPLQRSRWAEGIGLLELLMVLILVGILSATLIPKMLPTAGKSTAAYQAGKLVDNLRYTRTLAMASGKALKFKADPQSYRVVCSIAAACNNSIPAAASCPNPTTVLNDHGHHGPFCIALESGVTLTAPTELEFDLLGRPVAAAASNYQLFAGSSLMATVTVTPVTGFVSLAVVQ